MGVGIVAVAVFAIVAWVTDRQADARTTPARLPSLAVGRLQRLLGDRPVASTGARLALDASRRRRRRATQVGHGQRSARRRVTVAASGFHTSIQYVRDHQAHFGQPFDLQIETTAGVSGDADAALSRLSTDPMLDSVADVTAYHVTVGGQFVEAYTHRAVSGGMQVVVRRGRTPVGDDEIALGPALARDLEVDVGDLVAVESVEGSRRR